jgi:hypothetical protein
VINLIVGAVFWGVPGSLVAGVVSVKGACDREVMVSAKGE